MKTPVVFLVFNRPDTTKKVFEAIRQAQPKQLLVIADGARLDKPGEVEKCADVRSIIDTVDWDCEVLTNYSDTNLGCKKRVSSGLDWAFSFVEEAIIIEDDCLPNTTFFRFCEEMLDKYRNDEKVMAICGNNPLGKWKSKIQSYHFSYFFNCWGWATWKRVWQMYDVDMRLWKDKAIQDEIKTYIDNKSEFILYKSFFDSQQVNKKSSWGFSFYFLCLLKRGLIINSSVNLISNIGYGEDATHTKARSNNINSNRATYSMTFPLREPRSFCIDRSYTLKQYAILSNRSLFNKFRRIAIKAIGI